MRKINTVTGEIVATNLGAVLSHEHFVFGYPGFSGDLSFDAYKGKVKEDYFKYCKNIFDRLKSQYGVKTVVDPTPNDCGRNVLVLKELSEYLGINIICSTGYYSELEGAPSYFKFRKTFGCDITREAYDLMHRELYDGIEDTGIKAGVIKLASSLNDITDYEKHFFEAACRIAKDDPEIRIITHLSSGTAVKEQADFFRDHGVRPRQVCIGHICGNSDMVLQTELLKEGFFAGYDRFGLVGFAGCPQDEVRIDQIVELFKAGCGGNILISTDRIGYNFGRENNYDQKVYDSMALKQKWEYVFDELTPNMEKRGLSKADTRALVVDNPVRFFGE